MNQQLFSRLCSVSHRWSLGQIVWEHLFNPILLKTHHHQPPLDLDDELKQVCSRRATRKTCWETQVCSNKNTVSEWRSLWVNEFCRLMSMGTFKTSDNRKWKELELIHRSVYLINNATWINYQHSVRSREQPLLWNPCHISTCTRPGRTISTNAAHST